MRGPRLLSEGDPTDVVYSLLLFERTAEGNALCAQLDNLDQPFDVNDGMKIELGSTAKLRTLAHYLEIVGELHGRLAPLGPKRLRARWLAARDPLTYWAALQFLERKSMPLDTLLAAALDREYSASPERNSSPGAAFTPSTTSIRRTTGAASRCARPRCAPAIWCSSG